MPTPIGGMYIYVPPQEEYGYTYIAATQQRSDYSYTVYPESYSAYALWKSWYGSRTVNFYLYKGKKRKKTLPYHYYERTTKIGGGSTFTTEVKTQTPWGFDVSYVSEPGWKYSSFWPEQVDNGAIADSELDAYNKAVMRLSDKVAKMKINVGQAFAERKQTVDLIEKTIHRIYFAAYYLKKGRPDASFEVLGLKRPSPAFVQAVKDTPKSKRLANYWLELQFGWSPLLEDVYGAAELLASRAMGEHYTEAMNATANALSFSDVKQNGALWGSLDAKCHCRLTAKYHLDDPARQALAQTGISNPALLAWELLPYSFVYDWFMPVNQYLKTLYAFDGFQFIKGTKALTYDVVYHRKHIFSYSYNGNSQVNSGHDERRWLRYMRTPTNQWPEQVLKFRNPLDRGPLWKIATSLALLRQLFK